MDQRRRTWSWCRRSSGENPEFHHALGSADGHGKRESKINNKRAMRTGVREGKRETAKPTGHKYNAREVQSEHKRAVQTEGIRHTTRMKKKHLKASILLIQGAGWILVEGQDHLRTLKHLGEHWRLFSVLARRVRVRHSVQQHCRSVLHRAQSVTTQEGTHLRLVLRVGMIGASSLKPDSRSRGDNLGALDREERGKRSMPCSGKQRKQAHRRMRSHPTVAESRYSTGH